MRYLLLLCLLCTPLHAQVNRVVTLAPSLTEMVCALGRCDNLVGVTSYCTYPQQVKALPKVGGYINPNLEVMAAMRPDLVLTVPEQQDAAQKLNRLGIKAVTIKNYAVADINAAILEVGALLDRTKEAEALVANLKMRTAVLTKKRDRKPTVLVTLGHALREDTIKEIYIVGRNGFLNEMLQMAGGENIYDKDQPFFPKLSHEMLLRYDPDIIIDLVPKANLTPEEEAAHRRPWRSMSRLKAVRNGRYHLVAQEFVLQAGPRYIETLAAFSKILDTVTAETAGP